MKEEKFSEDFIKEVKALLAVGSNLLLGHMLLTRGQLTLNDATHVLSVLQEQKVLLTPRIACFLQPDPNEDTDPYQNLMKGIETVERGLTMWLKNHGFQRKLDS